jgi:PqqD family protein of HPr-rel-A system
MQWRGTRASIQWRAFGDESLAFNPQTGSTHLLNLVDREALELLLAENSLAQPQIVQRLAQALEIDADAALEEYVASLLPQLEQVGLIESVPL